MKVILLTLFLLKRASRRGRVYLCKHEPFLTCLRSQFCAADISYNAKFNSRPSTIFLHIVPQYFHSRCTACAFSSTRWAKTLAFLCGLVHLLGGDEHGRFHIGLPAHSLQVRWPRHLRCPENLLSQRRRCLQRQNKRPPICHRPI